MEIGQFIVKTNGACGGRARIAGRRIPVSSVYRWFLSGFGPEDILEKYEGLALAEIYAAITYALANREEIGAEVAQEDRLRERIAPTRSAASSAGVSLLRYHLDEDCQSAALATALRQHGMEVVTTNEANIVGADDDAQLEHAARHPATIVTNNIRDYTELHAQWLAQGRSHAGIVLFPQQEYSIGEVVRRLAHLRRTLSSEEMQGRLEWLSSWRVP